MKQTALTALAILGFAALIPSRSQSQSPAPPFSTTASPGDLVDAFHAAFGEHHARAVHTKGILLEGEFTPDPQAATLTTAAHLQTRPSCVLVRFSDFTGIPTIPDNTPSASPRGLAARFTLPDGTNTDIVCHTFNGFPVSTNEEFRSLLLAIAASGPTAPKPTPLDQFLATHARAKTFLTTQPLPTSWATAAYFGVNSFKFTNRAGESHFVRYQLVPTAGEQYLSADALARKDPEFLFADIKTRVGQGPFGFWLYAQVADAGDDVADPAVAWPDTRRRVLLGTIRVDRLAANTPEQDRATWFNPGNLQAGIEMADEMVKLRAAAYPISVKERQ